MTRYLPLLFVLAGCFPMLHEGTPEQKADVEAVGLELEVWDGIELTDTEWSCLRNFRVAYASQAEVTDWCRAGRTVWACTFTEGVIRRRQGVVMLADDVQIPDFGFRHEALHIALWCVYGDPENLTHASDYWADNALPISAGLRNSQ